MRHEACALNHKPRAMHHESGGGVSWYGVGLVSGRVARSTMIKQLGLREWACVARKDVLEIALAKDFPLAPFGVHTQVA